MTSIIENRHMLKSSSGIYVYEATSSGTIRYTKDPINAMQFETKEAAESFLLYFKGRFYVPVDYIYEEVKIFIGN